MDVTVKILVIRFSSIGDIVLTTPVLRALKQQMDGNIEIHYLTKKQYQLILENNPNISKVYTIEKSTNEVVSDLKNEGYDYIVDLHKNLRSKRVIKALKVLSFTFDKLNYKKWLLTRFKMNKLPDKHIVERYLEAIKPLGVEDDKKGLEYYIPEKDRVSLAALPQTHQDKFIGFAIGAQHFTKRLPEHKIIEICEKLNYPVVLLGGKEDVNVADNVADKIGEKVFNACGKFNLNQSASIVQQTETLITHDTGLMHIAAALGTKIISVWGNTVPDFGMYPYFPGQPHQYTIVENTNLKCRPCSKIGYNKCPKGHFKCMEEVDIEKIIAHI